MIIDKETGDDGRTMHTAGKMYGLTFEENWYIVGESDGQNGIPPFKLVAYKGHTLQGEISWLLYINICCTSCYLGTLLFLNLIMDNYITQHLYLYP